MQAMSSAIKSVGEARWSPARPADPASRSRTPRLVRGVSVWYRLYAAMQSLRTVFVRAPGLLLACALAACGSGETAARAAAQDEATVDEAAFRLAGPLRVEIVPPARSEIPRRREEGHAVALIKRTRSHMRLEIVGTIAREGDANLKFEGPIRNGTWNSRDQGVELRFDADGAIAGGGMDGESRVEFSGEHRLPQGMTLRMAMTLGRANGAGLPAGTRFEFAYELERDEDARGGSAAVSDDAPGHSQEEGDEDCPGGVEWKLRNVPNPTGGAMGLVRVPVCKEE